MPMQRRSRLAWVLVVFAFASSSALAGGSESTGVPVYTNEDLERMFGPPEAPAGQALPVAPSPELWERVQAFIEWEYGRLETSVAQELERRRQELERERLAREHPSGALLLAPLVGVHPWFRAHPFRAPHLRRAPAPAPPPGFLAPGPRLHPTPPLREFLNERPTIHARPPLTHRTEPSARPR